MPVIYHDHPTRLLQERRLSILAQKNEISKRIQKDQGLLASLNEEMAAMTVAMRKLTDPDMVDDDPSK